MVRFLRDWLLIWVDPLDFQLGSGTKAKLLLAESKMTSNVKGKLLLPFNFILWTILA